MHNTVISNVERVLVPSRGLVVPLHSGLKAFFLEWERHFHIELRSFPFPLPSPLPLTPRFCVVSAESQSVNRMPENQAQNSATNSRVGIWKSLSQRFFSFSLALKRALPTLSEKEDLRQSVASLTENTGASPNETCKSNTSFSILQSNKVIFLSLTPSHRRRCILSLGIAINVFAWVCNSASDCKANPVKTTTARIIYLHKFSCKEKFIMFTVFKKGASLVIKCSLVHTLCIYRVHFFMPFTGHGTF